MKNLLRILLLLISFNSFALSPEARLENEEQEKRAVELFKIVRCLVCQGQVIESSDSKFSVEMRQLIRKKISENKTNEEIEKELVEEFGEDVLTKISDKNYFIISIIIVIFALFLAFISGKRGLLR